MSSCTLCVDGSQPTNLDQPVSSGEGTCGSLALQSLEGGTEDCYLRQLIGYHECGCPTMPRTPEGVCDLCVNPNDSPNLDNIYHPFSSSRDCLWLAERVFDYSDGEFDCQQTQYRAFYSCGCTTMPSLPEGDVCTLCPDGSDPGSPNKNFGESLEDCAFVAEEVPFRFEYPDQCPSPWEVGRQCDCPIATGISCDICRGQGLMNPSEFVQDENGDALTCQALYNRGQQGLFEAWRCLSFQYMARETCCGAQVNCYACEDGSPVPDPLAKPSASGTSSCGLFDVQLGESNLDIDGCTVSQAIVGPRCGCPNPVANLYQGLCPLCTDGKVLDADGISTSTLNGFEANCVGVELNGNLNIWRGDTTCQELKDRYSNDCCVMPSAGASAGAGGGMPSAGTRGGGHSLVALILYVALLLQKW